MKTSEMIAMLEEEPKLRFTTKRYGNGKQMKSLFQN